MKQKCFAFTNTINNQLRTHARH